MPVLLKTFAAGLASMVMVPLLVVSFSATGDTSPKTDAELRDLLAQTHAQLATATRDRAELAHALAALQANSAAQARTATVRHETATEQRDAANDALDRAATEARVIALAAEVADNKAVLSALNVKLQNDELLRIAERNSRLNNATLITGAFGFLTLIAGFAWKWIVDARDHKWVQDSLQYQIKAHETSQVASMGAIAEVKSSAQAAYEVANTVNEKLLAIGVKMADGKPLSPVEHI